MGRVSFALLLVVALSVPVRQASADEPGNPGGIGVGLSIGTTGVGGEISARPFGNIVLRAGGGWFALQHDFSADDLTFDLKSNLVSAGATIDWHPFAGAFRLSAGGRYHNSDFSGQGSSITGAFTINGHPYAMATTGPIYADVTSSRTVAPYLGLGFDSTHFSDSRWALALDLGAVYVGKPSSRITAQNESVVPGLRADLDVEQKKLDDSLGKYGQFWPVATLTLKYRF